MAHGILGSLPGTEPRPLAVRAANPNHWTTWGVPRHSFLKYIKLSIKPKAFLFH